MPTHKVGRMAVCANGRIGTITKRRKRGFAGEGIDGEPWTSAVPRLLSRETQKLLEDLLEERNA